MWAPQAAESAMPAPVPVCEAGRVLHVLRQHFLFKACETTPGKRPIPDNWRDHFFRHHALTTWIITPFSRPVVIHLLHLLGVLVDEVAARLDFFAHQDAEHLVGHHG